MILRLEPLSRIYVFLINRAIDVTSIVKNIAIKKVPIRAEIRTDGSLGKSPFKRKKARNPRNGDS